MSDRQDDPAHYPRKRSRPSSGKLTAYLLARGWERSDLPADIVGECGATSDTVGYCEKPARWSKGPQHRGYLCAEHAAQTQRYDEPYPQLAFPPRESGATSLTAASGCSCPGGDSCGGFGPCGTMENESDEATVCVKHEWRPTRQGRDYDLPMIHGVESFVCVRCGASGTSDPVSGVRVVDAISGRC